MSLKNLLKTNLASFYEDNPLAQQFQGGGVSLENTNALNEGPAFEAAFGNPDEKVPGNIVFRSAAPPVATEALLNKLFRVVGASKNIGKIDTGRWSDGLNGSKSIYPLVWSNIDPIDQSYSPPLQNTTLYKTLKLGERSIIDGLRLTRFFSPLTLLNGENPYPENLSDNEFKRWLQKRGTEITTLVDSNYLIFKSTQRSLALQTPLVRGVERGFNILNVIGSAVSQGIGTRLRTAYSAPLTGLSLGALRTGDFRVNLDILGNDASNYLGVVKRDDETLIGINNFGNKTKLPASRLPGLYYRKIVGFRIGAEDRNNITSGDEDSNTLLRYFGGSDAPFGIGFTTINRWEFTNSKKVLKDATNIFAGFSDNNGGVGFRPNLPSPEYISPISFDDTTGTLIPSTPSFVSKISRYKSFNKENQPNGDGNGYGMSGGENIPYLSLPRDRKNRVDFLVSSKKSKDYINIKNDFNSDYKADDANLIKFSIEILSNDVSNGSLTASDYLYFRAFIDGFQDSYKPKWDSYKYVGRAENFYRYSAFERDISLSFTIAAFSRAEMTPLYNKINRLVGITAPDYSSAGLMRGQIVRLTVGDYLTSVPGIITGLNLTPIFDAGWDINRDNDGKIVSRGGINYTGQLPIAIKVDGFNFTPIHSFTPVKNSPFINFGTSQGVGTGEGSGALVTATEPLIEPGTGPLKPLEFNSVLFPNLVEQQSSTSNVFSPLDPTNTVSFLGPQDSFNNPEANIPTVENYTGQLPNYNP